MNKEKWFPMGYLIASVFFLFVLLGFIVWHYFHDHHGDTRIEIRGPIESKSGLGPTELVIDLAIDEDRS